MGHNLQVLSWWTCDIFMRCIIQEPMALRTSIRAGSTVIGDSFEIDPHTKRGGQCTKRPPLTRKRPWIHFGYSRYHLRPSGLTSGSAASG
jgi:hypothetical protein